MILQIILTPSNCFFLKNPWINDGKASQIIKPIITLSIII